MNDAKDRAAAYFDAKWGAEQAAAMGIDTKQHVPAESAAEAQSSNADIAFAARFRAKKALRNGTPPVTD